MDERDLKAMMDELNPAVNNNNITNRPPLGLMPKKFYYEQVRSQRFNEVCRAITRYYNSGLKINIDWIKEYNELIDSIGDNRG